MKTKHIEPDGRLYEILHRKFLGSREYNILKGEIKNYESTKLLVIKFLSYENLEDGINLLLEEDRIIDSITIGKLLSRINDFSDRIKLLSISIEEGLEIDHIIYWNFLQQTAHEGLAAQNKTLLKEIGHSLSTSENQKLNNKFAAHFDKVGGNGKLQIQLDYEEEAIQKKAICATDEASFFYLQGKAVGLTLLDSEFKEELLYIEELKVVEDTKLFEYELIKSEGVLEGIGLNQEISTHWLTQDIPAFIIIYLEDAEALSELYNYSITQGLYPYELKDVSQLNLSGCFFTDSLTLLQKVIETIDFDHFDVAVNIFFKEGNVQFFEKYPGSENWLQTDYPKTKALMPRFLTLKEGYAKTISSLFLSLYTPVVLSRSRSKTTT